MMRGPAPLLGAGLALALMTVSSAAFAAMQIQIQPIRLEMEAGRAGSFLLVNHNEEAAQIEARAFSWRQQADGKDELEPTRDVLLTPPIMRIAPGESQTIRLALRSDAHPAPGEEKTYRLMLEELPSGDAPPGVSLRMRYLLPVFVRNGAVTAGPVELRKTGEGTDCKITAENRGTAHVSVESLQAIMNNEEVEVDAPLYVLGNTRIELDCPEAAASRGRLEGIRLESDAGVFEDAGGADGDPRP